MRTTIALAAALALGIFTVPVAGDAQQATKLWRVGHLGYVYPTAANDLEACRHRLRDLGYVEGKNLVIESRSAESGFERLPELAAELVGLKVDVIAAFGNRTIMALKQATPTISRLQAADDSALVNRGQKNTERMLKALLGALGFEHVKVVFESRPRREPEAAARPRPPAGGPCTRGRVSGAWFAIAADGARVVLKWFADEGVADRYAVLFPAIDVLRSRGVPVPEYPFVRASTGGRSPRSRGCPGDRSRSRRPGWSTG